MSGSNNNGAGPVKSSRKCARASDKRTMQTTFAGLYQYEQATAVVRRTPIELRAGRLLDAWIAGDRRGLDHELNQWRKGVFEGREADAPSVDGEREELLHCVVD